MKQFKNFIAFRHEDATLVGAMKLHEKSFLKLEDALEARTIKNPTGSQWRSIGFVANPEGDTFYRNDSALLMVVAIRERVLPGAVLREEVANMAADIAERQGFKVGKKQFAEIREDAEAKLLPKAFIRETLIPIILRQKWMWVCTSSATKCDDAVGLLLAALDIQSLRRLEVNTSPEAWMTQVACNGLDESDRFSPGKMVALKGHEEAKGVITFRDEDVCSNRVGDLITEAGYTATKMALVMDGGGVADTTFTLDSKLVFRSVKLDGIETAKKGDDPVTHFDGNLTLTALAYQDMMRALVTSMGGVRVEPDDVVAQTASDMAKVRQGIRDAGGDLQPGVRAALDAADAAGDRYWHDTNTNHVFRSGSEPDDAETIEITREQYLDMHGAATFASLEDLIPIETTLNVFTNHPVDPDDDDEDEFRKPVTTEDEEDDDGEL